MTTRSLAVALSLALAGSVPAVARSRSGDPSGVKQTTAEAPAAAKAAESARYSESMRRLLAAAQRLRDATHAMAQQAPGPARNDAILQTNEAILATQQAMLRLPPDIRQAESSQPGYQMSMDRLKDAAQKLRQAGQAMADEGPGPRRNGAMRQANEALLETQQAMIDLIPDGRKTTGSGSGSSATDTVPR